MAALNRVLLLFLLSLVYYSLSNNFQNPIQQPNISPLKSIFVIMCEKYLKGMHMKKKKSQDTIDASELLKLVAPAQNRGSEFARYIQPRIQSDMQNYAMLGASGEIPGLRGSEYDVNAFYSKFGGVQPGKVSAFIPINDNWKVGGWVNPNDEVVGVPQRAAGIQFKGRF